MYTATDAARHFDIICYHVSPIGRHCGGAWGILDCIFNLRDIVTLHKRAMPEWKLCGYLCRDGQICNQRSVDGRCYRHQNRPQLTKCVACGRGTASTTSYCVCSRYKQIYVAHKRHRAAVKAAAAAKAAAELDEYINELLSLDWSGVNLAPAEDKQPQYETSDTTATDGAAAGA